jgi:hypothetical protein
VVVLLLLLLVVRLDWGTRHRALAKNQGAVCHPDLPPPLLPHRRRRIRIPNQDGGHAPWFKCGKFVSFVPV